MIKVISLILLSFSVSFAGVRTVGNGGGFGEMKAYLALQEMGRQIRLCFAVSSVCSFNNEQKDLLKKVLLSLESEQSVGGVQFFNDPTLKRTVETSAFVGAPLLINSSLLTESTGVAASFEKITGYVLFGLLQHQKHNLSTEELWNFSLGVFANFRESSSTNSFLVYGAPLHLHHLQVLNTQDSSLIYDGLLLEDGEKTVDLLAQAHLAAFCPKGSTFSVKIKGQNPGPRIGDLTVPILWSCDSKNWGKAIIYYHVTVDNKDLIVMPINSDVRGVVKPLTVVIGD